MVKNNGKKNNSIYLDVNVKSKWQTMRPSNSINPL